MQFSELQSTIEEYLLDLPSDTVALVPTWINQAVKDAEKRHNFRNMERTLQIVTTPNIRLQATAPVLYKQSRSDPFLIRNDGGVDEIDWAPSRSDMNRQYGDSTIIDIGSPQFILEIFDEDNDATEFHSYPFPDTQSLYTDGNYRLSLPTYEFSALMVQGSDSNYVTNNAEFYVIYKAVEYGMFFNRDEERAIAYKSLAEIQYKIFKKWDKRKRIQRRNELTISLGANRPSKVPRIRAQFGRRG